MSIPLILLFPRAGLLVALVALCLYPLLDVPRILGRPSWWRGAIVSALVWFVVFIALTQTADAVRPLRDDAMIFLFPFMLYPIALAISGVVRLEGRLRGRAPESGPRRASIAVGIAYALVILVPLTTGMIPVLIEKVTGNTPDHTVYSREGDVLSATPDRVTVRTSDQRVESFRIGPDTRFDFRGPGSPMVTGPAGPAWLKAGQRIGMDYVYRGGEAQVSLLTIWIDRKGCAGDAKWTAALQPVSPSPQAAESLVGTSWEGWIGAQQGSERRETTTFEFLEGDRLAYQDPGRARNTDGRWRQNGSLVLIEVNDCYAEYQGRIAGDEITGEFSNETGLRASWTARRKAAR